MTASNVYTIAEPTDDEASQTPAMCAGCPENVEESRLPRVYFLEDPVEYVIPFVTQASMRRSGETEEYGIPFVTHANMRRPDETEVVLTEAPSPVE